MAQRIAMRVAGLAAVALVLGTAMPAQAKLRVYRTDQIWRCKVRQKAKFIPAFLVVVYRPSKHHAFVEDGYIFKHFKQPIPAQVTEDDSDRLRMTWRLHGVEGHTTQGARVAADFRFKADFVKAADRLIVNSTVVDYRNMPGQGVYDCTERKR